ncbi:hypothetical protein GCM10012275_43370 [Longimycelium tulufanense]|uniref:Uncharacterized protein n=1 Tax=Longimycelium tulufanense TaxID=907463 RepID=A0A8J3CB44_9PSEU|nr:hypothetical protein [Longimycelium tulufanense]GGM68142.1 hypothetical protein GCM10012275_43370 [Longimycelium tulufanense]
MGDGLEWRTYTWQPAVVGDVPARHVYLGPVRPDGEPVALVCGPQLPARRYPLEHPARLWRECISCGDRLRARLDVPVIEVSLPAYGA